MRRTRFGIRKKRRNMNVGIALFFLVILPLLSIMIGSRITEWVVIPTINTESMLQSPGDITLENIKELGSKKEQDDTEEVEPKSEKENNQFTNKVDLKPLSFYMIQIASLADNKNIEGLIGELQSHALPHIIYRADNMYKIYSYGATDRKHIEEKLNAVREVYPDAYISHVNIGQRQIQFSDENKGTENVIQNLNTLVDSLYESSDALYNLSTGGITLEEYDKVLNQHENILTTISSNLESAELPENSFAADELKKMLDHQEKNIKASLEMTTTDLDLYKLHNNFLDTIFRTIEIFKI
ncbi:hypothetical protein [Alkaliphilus oremlandii]|uniref:Sporulation domain protein n=1 Tax=Alkaliphilus oremlandii (strain OhILAs) TaxID=350688 RepID=A8MHN4_ALKOO|nr:hypothetical protein [Alkaliphilus oremlandii]ABW19316.1 hypothetical protein Clos_1776 [Alkaliphilus oremlandii OhILAs]